MPVKLPLKARVRRALLDVYLSFSRIFFDPIALGARAAGTARALPIYGANLARYTRENKRPSLRFTLRDAWFRTFDRFSDAGSLTWHYFWQDLWAATRLFELGIRRHVDVGSRIDGFIAHVLTFCDVTYVDIRPIDVDWPKFHFMKGAILAMPFGDGEVPSLSALHVIEHIGLGRYGDPVQAEGPWTAARELARILAPGGTLLLGVPIGCERVCFDAHRIFAPETVREMFDGLDLVEFSFVDDRNRFQRNADFDQVRDAYYGCGLFEFRKPPASARELP
jgi:SAM-dependent methyltransferase